MWKSEYGKTKRLTIILGLNIASLVSYNMKGILSQLLLTTTTKETVKAHYHSISNDSFVKLNYDR